MTRAIARAERGAALNADEAACLLTATGPELDRLTGSAARVRDSGLRTRGVDVITYSPKVFIPVTRLCRDRCHYCTFATTPGHLARAGHEVFLSPDQVLAIARAGADNGCLEALFTLGDRPEDRWPQARAWLDERGYGSTLDYVRSLAIQVLEETGLLPHLNPGLMSWDEMHRMKPVAPSMGLMLESTAQRLFATPGAAHFGSPDKDPALRLRMIEDAGRLAIPFTTGVLVGIGETPRELADSIFALRSISHAYGSVQEVIVQNFRAKPNTAMRDTSDLPLARQRAAIAVARLILGPSAHVQAPPNLVDPDECLMLLDAGIDDWGGVSPVTADHVNPERPWPSIDHLDGVTSRRGFRLASRLTVYPKFVNEGTPWIDPRVLPHVLALAQHAGAERGYAIERVRPSGLPWQEPDGGHDSAGRTDLHSEIDHEGRATERRSDFGEIYGAWDSVLHAARDIQAPAVLFAEGGAALRKAQDNPGELGVKDAEVLMSADGGLLAEVVSLADDLRRQAVGDVVTYVVNRNINFTNVCYVGCRFCAFAQRESDADAYTLSLDEVADRAAEAWDLGATEVCMQGGIDPRLRAGSYFQILRAVRERVPDMHIHAFSPMEIANGAMRSGLSVRDFLLEARESGLGSVPGTAAEILDDNVRWILTKGKLPTQAWIDIITTAHNVGLPTTATMMYGHVDNPAHWVGHLRVIRSLQMETGGFTEFVPLPFVHTSSPIYLAGVARPGPTMRDNLAVHAMSRIMLHGHVHNIQTSWVKLGVDGTRAMLSAGCNDLGGTLMEETISRMAGSEHGSRKSVAELTNIASALGRPVRQRTTLYGEPATA